MILAIPERRHALNSRIVGESGHDHLGPAGGIWLFRTMKPGDIETLFGAGQSYVEKPPIFVPRRIACLPARGGDRLAIEILTRRPSDGLFAGHLRIKHKNSWIVPCGWHATAIWQKHDFCFEALGRMDGHHPHRVLGPLHVALDRVLQPREIVEKGRERRRPLVFVGDGETQKFVDGIAGFRSKSRFDIAASAISAEKARVENKRTAAGPRAPEGELGYGLDMLFIGRGFERIEKTAAAAWRERHKIVIAEPDERRFQHAGERQIVLRKQARAPRRYEIHDGDMMRELKPVGAGGGDLALFQGPDHRLEKRPACANEDQNVARTHRPRPQGLAVVHKFIGTWIDEMLNLFGDALGNKIGGVLRIEKIERKGPIARILAGLRRRPAARVRQDPAIDVLALGAASKRHSPRQARSCDRRARIPCRSRKARRAPSETTR